MVSVDSSQSEKKLNVIFQGQSKFHELWKYWRESEKFFELRDYLKEKAVRRGEVTLASGQKSDLYVNCKELSLEARGLAFLSSAFWKLSQKVFPDCSHVAGVSVGGDPLVAGILMEQKGELKALLVRKEAKKHGASVGKRVEGDEPSKTFECLMFEDVVSTGGSSLSAAESMVEAGYPLKGLFCIVDRQVGGVEKLAESLKVPVFPLFLLEDLK